MAKIVCVLYDDPENGYPTSYPRDDLPRIDRYPDGQELPSPKGIDFKPGVLLGSVSGELGLRRYLESQGHELVVTSDKDSEESELDRQLPDADIVISQPFWPAYMTAERIAKAKKLRMIVTAGIGSDHTDLQAAIDRNITVAEVTFCNSISVAEHVVMMILSLVRNYLPSHQVVREGGWNIADCAARSYDLEGMHVGTVAAGRIGLAVLRRLKPFDVHLHYYDRHRLPQEIEREVGVSWHASVADMVATCDVVTINCQLHPETERLFDEAMITDEARRLSGQHRARQDCRPRCRRSGAAQRPTGGLCRRRLVYAAGAEGSSLADDAQPRHDAPYFRHLAGGAGALCRRRSRNPGMLL
jgi:formate dehydrogenase